MGLDKVEIFQTSELPLQEAFAQARQLGPQAAQKHLFIYTFSYISLRVQIQISNQNYGLGGRYILFGYLDP